MSALVEELVYRAGLLLAAASLVLALATLMQPGLLG
jgi:hypothetical protein